MNLLKPYQQKIADDFSKIYTVMNNALFIEIVGSFSVGNYQYNKQTQNFLYRDLKTPLILKKISLDDFLFSLHMKFKELDIENIVIKESEERKYSLEYQRSGKLAGKYSCSLQAQKNALFLIFEFYHLCKNRKSKVAWKTNFKRKYYETNKKLF